MKQLNKKGQVLENLGALGIGIVTFAIIIVVAFLMMVQTKEAGYGLIDATAYTNATTAVTAGTASLVNGGCIDETTISVSQITNLSGATSISYVGVNYTVTTNYITIPVVMHPGANVNITYSCKLMDNAYNSTEELQEATATVPGWIPLIVIVIIGGVILGIVRGFNQ